jgi:hypothetical protein
MPETNVKPAGICASALCKTVKSVGAWVSNAIDALTVLNSDITHTQAMDNVLAHFVAALQMFFDNALQYRLVRAAIPYAFGIHDQNRPIFANGKTAGTGSLYFKIRSTIDFLAEFQEHFFCLPAAFSAAWTVTHQDMFAVSSHYFFKT